MMQQNERFTESILLEPEHLHGVKHIIYPQGDSSTRAGIGRSVPAKHLCRLAFSLLLPDKVVKKPRVPSRR